MTHGRRLRVCRPMREGIAAALRVATLAAVLLHSLVGCCWHHVHEAGEAPPPTFLGADMHDPRAAGAACLGGAEVGGATHGALQRPLGFAACGDHDAGPRSHHGDDCSQGRCVFPAAREGVRHLSSVPLSPLPAAFLARDVAAVHPLAHRCLCADNAAQRVPPRLYLLYQLLLV